MKKPNVKLIQRMHAEARIEKGSPILSILSDVESIEFFTHRMIEAVRLAQTDKQAADQQLLLVSQLSAITRAKLREQSLTEQLLSPPIAPSEPVNETQNIEKSTDISARSEICPIGDEHGQGCVLQAGHPGDHLNQDSKTFTEKTCPAVGEYGRCIHQLRHRGIPHRTNTWEWYDRSGEQLYHRLSERSHGEHGLDTPRCDGVYGDPLNPRRRCTLRENHEGCCIAADDHWFTNVKLPLSITTKPYVGLGICEHMSPLYGWCTLPKRHNGAHISRGSVSFE